MATKSIAWNTGSGNITLTYTGQGNGTIAVESDANDLGSARSQTIVVQTTDGVVTQNLTVSQAACPVPVGTVLSYSYTGAVQSVTLPAGTYKLQVWGAQGGSNAAASSYSISAQSGGKGGYSEGIITLSQPTTMKVYVGGQGSSSAGGYNGGGSTTGSSSYSTGTSGQDGYTYGTSRMGGGGGGTDIRLSDGALLSRMIVAGGGSGGAACYKAVTSSGTQVVRTISGSSISSAGGFINASNGQWDPYHPNEYYGALISVSSNRGDTCVIKKNSNGNSIYWNILKDSSVSGGVVPKPASGYSTGRLVSSSDVTCTIPSDANLLYVYMFDTPNVWYTPSSITFSRTGTSTSTSTDYQAGYAGGGTSGVGTYPGTQSSAGSNGSFGSGAAMSASNYRYCSGAGGGGWYGGGSAYSDSTMSYVRYMGGGSGFVNIAANAQYRPSGYTGLQLDSGETKAGNTSFPNTAGTGNETGHAGNGYAKITRIAAYSVTLRFKDEEDSPVTGASVTVSNSEYTYSLTTDSNGEATASMINGTYNVVCSGYSLTPSQIIVSSNATIDIVAAAPSIMDFSYTGAVQNATLRAGTYKIECWGAQGGYRSSTTYGGKGGYSVGELTLSQNTNIYVYVGGAGNTGGTSGGFNGGGMRATYAGGGGGSDVRIGTDSLYARVIVAGGGGSDGATSKQGMYGGGTTGGTTTQSYGTGGGGGTQTSGGTGSSSASGSGTSGTYGAFGVGGRGYTASSGYAGAGGGGWYGGAGSYPDGSGDDDRGGGGGSGYVYNSSTASNYPSGCLLNSSHYLANSQTIAGNASMPSTSGSTETGHSGNGYVRITKI